MNHANSLEFYQNLALNGIFTYHISVVRSELSLANRIFPLAIPGIPPRQLCAALVSLLLLSGCSTYQNVTGYFNTYYNARKLFNEAVAEVEKVPQKNRDTAYYSAYNIPPGSKAKFDKVIEKSSKLIQFYSRSSWIDDALYMIAVSYVYKDENESAIRKFKELYENFPTSSYLRQAKLWHAKADYFMKKDDEALKMTKDLFEEARTEGDNDVLLGMLTLEGQIYFDRHEYDQAAVKYSLAVEVSGDNDLRGAAQYMLALTNERMGDYEKAASAYNTVSRFSPDFASVFRARLKYGHMLSLAKQYDRALTALDNLMDEKLSTDQLSLVDLEIANTDWLKGDSTSAFALYSYIDTTYRNSDASARANFQRGVIFEKKFAQFRNALAYYTKARDQFPGSEINPLAQQKTMTLTNYFKCLDNIHKYDSLLTVALHPDTSKAASQDRSAGPADTSASVPMTAHIVDSAAGLNGETPRPQETSARLLPGPDDSLGRGVVSPPELTNEDEMPLGRGRGGITHSLADSTARPYPGETMMRQRLSPPGVRDSLMAKMRPPDSTNNRRSPPRAMPQIPLTPDSLRSLLARDEFEVAGLFYLELNLPDSGLIWFRHVVDQYPVSALIPRTLYSMAEIYRTKGDTLKVDSLYEMILSRFEQSEYAGQIRRLLKMDSLKMDEDRVLVAYRKAEQFLTDTSPDRSLQHLKSLVESRSALLYRPKILYAVGWIYENVLVENDSAAAWYKRLVKEYPSSIYAADVQERLAVKADPKTLPQFVKIKEIVPMGRPEKARTARTLNQHQGKNPPEEEVQGSRNVNRDQDDDEQEEPPEEEDTSQDEPDDNN